MGLRVCVLVCGEMGRSDNIEDGGGLRFWRWELRSDDGLERESNRSPMQFLQRDQREVREENGVVS